MVTLLLNLCLLAHPTSCHDDKLVFSPYMVAGRVDSPITVPMQNLMQACNTRAQVQIAKKRKVPAGYYLKGYRCVETSKMMAKI